MPGCLASWAGLWPVVAAGCRRGGHGRHRQRRAEARDAAGGRWQRGQGAVAVADARCQQPDDGGAPRDAAPPGR
ncbi:hypothetical protein G6F24_018753 [Rhizopus arrhizus]|nr:hypothetical protein G6F24_018753 [Rhizopus arrhizus]